MSCTSRLSILRVVRHCFRPSRSVANCRGRSGLSTSTVWISALEAQTKGYRSLWLAPMSRGRSTGRQTVANLFSSKFLPVARGGGNTGSDQWRNPWNDQWEKMSPGMANGGNLGNCLKICIDFQKFSSKFSEMLRQEYVAGNFSIL